MCHRRHLFSYFRGESNSDWDLAPGVMRPLKDSPASLRSVEGEMLVDLRSRRAEDFVEGSSALDQMVMAQHHGLPTRLLDVTLNLWWLFSMLVRIGGKPRCGRPDSRVRRS